MADSVPGMRIDPGKSPAVTTSVGKSGVGSAAVRLPAPVMLELRRNRDWRSGTPVRTFLPAQGPTLELRDRDAPARRRSGRHRIARRTHCLNSQGSPGRLRLPRQIPMSLRHTPTRRALAYCQTLDTRGWRHPALRRTGARATPARSCHGAAGGIAYSERPSISLDRLAGHAAEKSALEEVLLPAEPGLGHFRTAPARPLVLEQRLEHADRGVERRPRRAVVASQFQPPSGSCSPSSRSTMPRTSWPK